MQDPVSVRIVKSAEIYGPLVQYFNPILDAKASAQACGVFAMRWACNLLHYFHEECINKELLAILVSAIYHSESAISAGHWGCFYSGKNDPINNVRELVSILGKSKYEISDLDKCVIDAVTLAIWSGTRVSTDLTWHENGGNSFSIDVCNYHSITNLGYPAQVCLFATLTKTHLAVSKHSSLKNERLLQALEEEILCFVDGYYSEFESIGQFKPPITINDDIWTSELFAPLRLSVLGRDGWAETVTKEFEQLNITEAELNQSLSLIGPEYNQTDIDGIPIPGLLNRLHDKNAVLGYDSIHGLEKTANGFDVIGIASPAGAIPLIYPEDISVIISLAYGEDEPITPTFSLVNYSKVHGDLETREFILQKRVFKPSWIQNTLLGQSMFFADYLLQQIIGQKGTPLQSIKNFRISRTSIGNKKYRTTTSIEDGTRVTKSGFDQDLIDRNASEIFLEEMYSEEGESPENDLGGRFCICLTDIGVENRENTLITYLSGGCYIESSFKIKNDDGSINHLFRLNDRDTNIGISAKKFSSNFEKIGNLFPVFLRVEQLLILHRLVSYAHECGWSISDAELKFSQRLISKQKKNKQAALYAPMSYHNFGCKCCGQWPKINPIRGKKNIDDRN